MMSGRISKKSPKDQVTTRPTASERPVPRRHERSDDGNAFIPDPEGGPAHTSDDLAESLAEEFLQSATSGEDAAEDMADQVVAEELGGPFVETSAQEEFARGTDESNPPDAEREPLPLTSGGRRFENVDVPEE
jgi:hypothetical protein